MKVFFIGCLFLFSGFIQAQQITIDEDQVKVSFVFTDQDVDGELGDFTFTGAIDLSSITTATISGSVATETLDTNNWLRNRHLRGKKYFSVNAHPKLYFKSDTIEVTSTGFRVSGIITIKGITQHIIWDFEQHENILIGTTSINTHDYDIMVYDERSRNEVVIKILLPYI